MSFYRYFFGARLKISGIFKPHDGKKMYFFKNKYRYIFFFLNFFISLLLTKFKTVTNSYISLKSKLLCSLELFLKKTPTLKNL